MHVICSTVCTWYQHIIVLLYMCMYILRHFLTVPHLHQLTYTPMHISPYRWGFNHKNVVANTCSVLNYMAINSYTAIALIYRATTTVVTWHWEFPISLYMLWPGRDQLFPFLSHNRISCIKLIFFHLVISWGVSFELAWLTRGRSPPYLLWQSEISLAHIKGGSLRVCYGWS